MFCNPQTNLERPQTNVNRHQFEKLILQGEISRKPLAHLLCTKA